MGQRMVKKKAAVVFIHGLARKPPPAKLQEIWSWGLRRNGPQPSVFAPPNQGIDLATAGRPQFHTYWADVFYGDDYETEYEAYYESDSDDADVRAEGLDVNDPILNQLDVQTPRERRFIASVERQLRSKFVASDTLALATSDQSAQALEMVRLLPMSIRNSIIERFAKEAYYFLFDKPFKRKDNTTFQVRKELRGRLLKELRSATAAADSVTIVSHSMGTMIAYDVLRNCEDCPPIDTLITLGSPLGIAEVQDELMHKDRDSIDFPAARLKRWHNIFDPLDPICGLDPHFSNDYESVEGKSVEDIEEGNWGGWRHTITHYLAGKKFRQALAESISVER